MCGTIDTTGKAAGDGHTLPCERGGKIPGVVKSASSWIAAADNGDLSVVEAPYVTALLAETIEELVDSVGAGQNDPIETFEARNRVVESLP